MAESKQIALTKGKHSTVDEDDYELLNQYKWRFGSRGYAVRTNTPLGAETSIHRTVMNAPSGKEVDHINGDRLDNRKTNLRICSHGENMRNRKVSKFNKSGNTGVCFSTLRNKWRAYITLDSKYQHLGEFDTQAAAITARADAEAKYYGGFQWTKLS